MLKLKANNNYYDVGVELLEKAIIEGLTWTEMASLDEEGYALISIAEMIADEIGERCKNYDYEADSQSSYPDCAPWMYAEEEKACSPEEFVSSHKDEICERWKGQNFSAGDVIDQYLEFADLVGSEEALMALLKGIGAWKLEEVVPLIFRDYEYDPSGENFSRKKNMRK